MLSSAQLAGNSVIGLAVAESSLGADVAANASLQYARPLGRVQRVTSTSVAALLSIAITTSDPVEAFGRADWSSGSIIDHQPAVAPTAIANFQAELDERNAGLSAEIASYRHLKDRWDGPGSIAPSARAIDDALAMIDKLPVGAKLPEAMVSGDGEVGFYWQTERGYIDIGFKGNGKIAYYARTAKGVAKGVDDFSPRHRLSQNLVKAIESI